MQTQITDYVGTITVSSRQEFRNLAVYPLLGPDQEAADYLLLDEALAAGALDIVEVTQGGSVPELKVVNRAGSMVLLLDGEELVGARQNRIVNTTILIAANATTVIPVSCVEQGRWAYRSRTFYSEERVMSPNLRAMKAEQVNESKKTRNCYDSDQSAIWSELSWKAHRMNAKSETMAMADIYDTQRPSIQEYVQHFALEDGQIGAAFLINGRIVGIDCFGRQKTFARVFTKLLESYALDAIDGLELKDKTGAAGNGVAQFLESVRAARAESSPSVALGTDVRLESETAIGFALSFDDRVLHLSAFAREKQPEQEAPRSRMQRFSGRRRNRE
jgi:hypothetical protein